MGILREPTRDSFNTSIVFLSGKRKDAYLLADRKELDD